MSDVSAFARLVGAGWVLVRADLLIPRELDPMLPPSVRGGARLLRLFCGPQARQGRPGERLARAFERLGPATIKLGQVLSTRADIFGKEFADDLGRLKDRLPPFPTVVARAAIAQTLDRPVESLFTEFSDPIGAASLAQAHAATLTDGRKVAVKVLRPGVERLVAKDLEMLALAARIIERLAPPARRLEPKALIATVSRSMTLELDLRLEAAGASELGEIMAKDGFMQAPKVVWPGVGRRALTLEWAGGVALSDPAALEQPGIDRHALADNLVRAFLSQALDFGVFHADLHEGNLFVAAPSTITAIDFGILGRLDAKARRHLAEILWGFLQRDYMRVAKAHFDAGYVPQHHSIEAFAQALRAVGEPSVGRASAEVSMGRLLGLLFEITAIFDMRLRPELVLLQKTMVTVEGVSRRIDPSHNLWASAEPVVSRWITRELSPMTRARELAENASRALKALAQLAEPQGLHAADGAHERAQRERRRQARDQRHGPPLVWFALGAAVSGIAFMAAAFLGR
ncbi:MAG: 2-polyprenylphenol 6-hydroxylase [Caulobacteraceae bacterium]|nr:2-polyprenylphenol 6-hydroxylase [Caulobacteraceae bacterium]